jgi:hypothetical protein
LKYVNGDVGYGVYATTVIPKGTIVYVRDPLDIEISPQAFMSLDEGYRKLAEKYSFIDEKGNRVMSWDWAKFVNHRCDCNTMSAGYGFEIAIRDIQADEEITDEYGLFNLEQEMPCCCGSENCRKMVRATDVDTYYPKWDRMVKGAIDDISRVTQPLWPFMDAATKNTLEAYLQGRDKYISVRNLKYSAVGFRSVNITTANTAVRKRRARAI